MCAPSKSTPKSIKHWLDVAAECRKKGEPLWRFRVFGRFWDFYLTSDWVYINTWVEETPNYHALEFYPKGVPDFQKNVLKKKRFSIF